MPTRAIGIRVFHGYLHRDGRVSVPLKGNLWKSFFHHPRALRYCALLCDEMKTT